MLLLFLTGEARADATYDYAVQNAPSANKPADDHSELGAGHLRASNYTIYRKSETATTWGDALAKLDGSVTNYTDTNVQVGALWYQISKVASVGYKGFGYIYSGIEAPLIENRGTLILVVATNSAIGLSNELTQLQSDLTGDGWSVICENDV